MVDVPIPCVRLLQSNRAVRGVARADLDGTVHDRAGQLDADALCAVGVVAQAQLSQLGEALSAGKLKRWYVVSDEQTLWVNECEDGVVVAIGTETRNPEPTSKALARR